MCARMCVCVCVCVCTHIIMWGCLNTHACVCVCVCVSFDLVLNSLCSHDILDVLTLVNYEVGKGDALIDGGLFKQSPAPMYSLRKKLIFRQPQ